MSSDLKRSALRTICCFLILGWLIASGPVIAQEKPSAEVKAARKSADTNLRTAEGSRYDAVISQQFQESYQESMQTCVKSATPSDLANFNIFAKIAKDGAVTKVFPFPKTKVAACLAGDVLKGTFAPPPRPDYWIKIEMNITD